MDQHGGFSSHSLDEDAFGESKAAKTVRAFDAFPKTKATYTQQSSAGGVWTVVLVLASIWLACTELGRWWAGETKHTFDVEHGVGHDLQLNFDVIVKMRCDDLNINIQDASGDRILASMVLKKDNTTWDQWLSYDAHKLGVSKQDREGDEFSEQDVHDFLALARGRKNYKKTPRLPRGVEPDSCRIAGTVESNKCGSDLHITAAGHGYQAFGQHLSHDKFNFTHHIMELSFGPFYPALVNPLDNTISTLEHHFSRVQYYLSVVPTVYTTNANALRRAVNQHHESPTSGEDGLRVHKKRYAKDTVFTNQYAVTEQTRQIPEQQVPGIFFKYDVEPIMLTIAEEWMSFPALFIRLVNVVSGVLVTGGWLYTMSEWAKEQRARGRKQGAAYDGILDAKYGNGGMDKKMGY